MNDGKVYDGWSYLKGYDDALKHQEQTREAWKEADLFTEPDVGYFNLRVSGVVDGIPFVTHEYKLCILPEAYRRWEQYEMDYGS